MNHTERKRLQVVRQFDKLNLNHNKELDDLILLVLEICRTPIVLVTLMEETTQLIKCQSGLAVEQIRMEDTFCRYLKGNEIMVVPDAIADERFANLPAVTGELGIRFYAGAPLVTSDGYHIGSLCVADHKPGTFSDNQIEMLAIISRQVVFMMELQLNVEVTAQHNLALKQQKEKTAASERKLRGFFNSSKSCHVLLGPDLKVLDFNNSTVLFIRETQKKEIKAGQNIIRYVSKASRPHFDTGFKQAMTGQRVEKEIQIMNGPELIWWNTTFQPVKDPLGNITSVAYSATNIDERKKQVAEILSQNESLLKIAYIQSHDYRRPVASIMGLMGLMQLEDYQPDKEWLLMMKSAVNELDGKIREVVSHIDQLPVGIPTEM